MKDDRLRVPIDSAYLEPLGRAVICFARLEWIAVWCCEKLQPDYVRHLGKRMSAKIADDLCGLVPAGSDVAAAATDFRRLVARRNDLLHAKPGTTDAGEQRLFRHEHEWTIAAIEDIADEFTACELRLSKFYHDR